MEQAPENGAAHLARPVLTITEWAEMFGVCTRTVQRQIKRGDVRTIRVAPNVVRIPVTEAHRILDGR